MSTTTPRKPRSDFDRTCERCGAVFRTTSRTAKYCPECRKIVARESARKSYAKRRQLDGDRLRELERERAKRYRTNHPEKAAEATRRWKKKHADQVREYNRQYAAEHREHVRGRNRESYRRNYPNRKVRKARKKQLRQESKTNSTAFVELAALSGQLRECPRLHTKALHLPCGQRAECFGVNRCSQCPPDATPPKTDTSWGWGGGSC